MAARKPTPPREPDPPVIVRESFVIEVDGVPVAYRKGEPVDPTDPVLRRMGERYFEPLVYQRFGRTTTPEVRS